MEINRFKGYWIVGFWLILWGIIISPAFSTVYYIDPVNGDDATGEPDNIDKPYKRLKIQFRYTVKPGDTFYLRGGVYNNDFFQPANNGTEENPITVTNYPGEIPIFSGPGAYGVIINLHGRKHYLVEGVYFENTQGDTTIKIGMDAEYNVIRDCHFKTHIWGNMITLEMAQYNLIDNCTFDTVGSPENEGTASHIMIKGGHHNLIQNNHLVRAGHSSILVEQYTGDYEPPYQNVIRNNVIEQHWGTGVSLGLRAHDTLVEGNEIYYCGEGVPEHEKSSVHIRSDNNILRNNVTAFTGATTPKKHYGIEMEAYRFGVQQNCRNNRFYNNIVYKSGNAGIFVTQRTDCSLTNNKVMNNIIYHNKVGGSDPYWSTSSIVFDVYHAYEGYKWESFANNNYFYNNIMLHADAEGDEPHHLPFVYYNGSPSFTKTVAQTGASFPQAFYDNLEENPEFINPDDKIFHLKPESPAIDQGAFLTQTVVEGIDTVNVVVEDALFFCDGYGIIDADLVKIGPNPPVRITSVDYENNTLIVETPVSFSIGFPVSLPYYGDGPDIGAFEYTGSPYNRPPVLLAIGNRQGEELQTLNFTLSAVDPDGDSLTFSADGLPEESTFNELTRTFNWTPLEGQAGTYENVTFTVSDATAGDSETITITIHPAGSDFTPPSISNVENEPLDSSTVQVNWNTDEPADSRVEYGLTAAYGGSTPLDSNLSSNHPVQVNGLEPNTTYHFRVRSKDGTGNEGISQDFTFTTLPPPPDTTPPQILNVYTHDIVLNQVEISWETDEDTSGYVLCDQNAGNLTEGSVLIRRDSSTPGSTNHNIQLTALEPDTLYYYRVVALDGDKNESRTEDPLSFQTRALEGDESMVTFRYGLNGYTSCWDFEISQQQPDAHIFRSDLMTVKNHHVRFIAGDSEGVRPLLKFDVSTIPQDAIILSALLKTTFTYFYGGSIVYLHHWTEEYNLQTATRNTIDGTNPWTGGGNGGGDVPDEDNDFEDEPDAIVPLQVPGTYDFPVTDIVQDWVSGEKPNYGWLFRCLPELTSNRAEFRPRKYSNPSEALQLVVIYKMPDSAPDAPAFDPVPPPRTGKSSITLEGTMSEEARLQFGLTVQFKRI